MKNQNNECAECRALLEAEFLEHARTRKRLERLEANMSWLEFEAKLGGAA